MKKIVFLSLLTLLVGVNLMMAQNRSGDALYSQMDDAYRPYDYAYSFEYAADPTYDSYGADDFEVPAGETWEIYSVKSIMKSTDAGTTMNVFIYADDAGKPGAELYHFDDVTSNNVVTLPGYDTYEIETNLPSTVTLTEGVYWISIANELNSNWDAGNWLYQETSTTILSPAHIINPGGGQGSWFPSEWTPEPWSSYKNLSFALFAPPLPNDLTVSEIISPVSGELTATQTIEIAVANVGSLEQTAFDVQYQVNGGSEVVESVSTTILPNETYNYVFNTTADMSALGDYTVVATVILAGDENTGNDSYEITVTNYGPIYELNATSTSETTCVGLFTDAGGLFDGFESTDGGSITFYPETPGSRVSLDFTAFDFGYNTHHFVIYDGETTSDNILYTYVEDGYGYGEHNDPPTYIRARNEIGALTIELIPYQYMYGVDPGWVAEIGCMIPEDIDFTVIDMQMSEGFYSVDMPVQITTHVVNSGATAQSRLVGLNVDGTQVLSVATATLNPGEVEEIMFTWYPQFTGNDISVSVEIEDDPGDTNEDNNLETLVDVYSQFALVESFEGSTVIPEYWDVTEGEFERKTYNAYHGEYYLQNVYASSNSTLITPLLEVNDGDMLRFYAQGFDKNFDIIYSQDKNGPWEVLTSYNSAIVSNTWSYFETDLSSLADENYYYIGIAASNSGPYNGVFRIDMVTGPDKKFYDYNLDVFDTEISQFPAIGREAHFSITVKNMGLEDVSASNYTVKLMVDSRAEEIASVQGKDVGSFMTTTLDFYYEFSDDDASEVYFEISFDNDEDLSNNISGATKLYIQPEGTYDYFLEGDYDNPYPYDRYPIACSYQHSLSELIYYPEEVQGSGNITGITLEYYAATASPYVPLRIWMGTTSESVLTEWITADELDLVFDGIVDFDATSWEEFYFELDTTFNYEGDENLLIMIDKGSSAVSGNVYFRTKDMNIYYKGLLTNSNGDDIDPYNPDPSLYLQKFDHIPAMRFLIHSEDALQFTTEPVTNAEKEMDYIYEVGVTNNLGGDITISEGVYFPDWLTLTQNSRGDATATLSGTPEILGDFDVQISATYGTMETTQTFTITVVPFINIISTPQTNVQQGNQFTYVAEAEYNGYNEVTFEEGIIFPDWLSINNTNGNTATITGTPTESGYHQVDIVATDGLVESNQTFMINVVAIPVFVSEPVTLVGEGHDYEYNVIISYDGPYLHILEGNTFPEWLTLVEIDDNTASIYGSTDQVGDYQVEIIAEGYMISETQMYTLTVGAIPSFISDPVIVIDANQTYIYEVEVAYNSNQPCEIIAGDNMPDWMTLSDHGNNTATLTGIPTELEAYEVDLIAQGEYFNDTQSFTVDVVVGLNEITNDMVHIYPNPVTNHFYITNMNTATIHIMDITGKIVSSMKADSDNFKMDVTGLQEGLYIIRSSDNQFNINKKIIIK